MGMITVMLSLMVLVSIKDNSIGGILLQALSTNNLYHISLSPAPESASSFLALDSSRNTKHRWLGHCGAKVLDILRKNKLVSSSVFHDNCVICRLSKSHCLPFQLVEHSSVSPLQLVHFNAW